MAFQTRFDSLLTVVAATALFALACGPARGGFTDAQADVPRLDVPVDTGVDTGVDVQPVDAMACVAATCTSTCQGLGYSGGACTMGVCGCAGVPIMDAGVPDGVSTVTMCAANGDCPSTEFCSGPGCGAMGFCYPRGTVDPTTCGTDGPAECGCDGHWYANGCARLSAGMRLNDNQTACGAAPDAGTTGG